MYNFILIIQYSAIAKSSLEIRQKAFTGGLKYDNHDVLYRELALGERQYVGLPCPEIDQAWDDLLTRK